MGRTGPGAGCFTLPGLLPRCFAAEAVAPRLEGVWAGALQSQPCCLRGLGTVALGCIAVLLLGGN